MIGDQPNIVMFLFGVYGTYDFVCLFLHLARGAAVGPVHAPRRSLTLVSAHGKYNNHISMISDVPTNIFNPPHTRTKQISLEKWSILDIPRPGSDPQNQPNDLRSFRGHTFERVWTTCRDLSA